MCFAFQRGKCTRDEKCKFAHAISCDVADTTGDEHGVSVEGGGNLNVASEVETGDKAGGASRPVRDDRKCKTTHSVEELIMPRVKELFGVEKVLYQTVNVICRYTQNTFGSAAIVRSDMYVDIVS